MSFGQTPLKSEHTVSQDTVPLNGPSSWIVVVWAQLLLDGVVAMAVAVSDMTVVNLFVAIKSQFPVQRIVWRAICYELVVHKNEAQQPTAESGTAALRDRGITALN